MDLYDLAVVGYSCVGQMVSVYVCIVQDLRLEAPTEAENNIMIMRILKCLYAMLGLVHIMSVQLCFFFA